MKKHNPAGTKLANRSAKGTLTMRHKPGIVTKAIREEARERFLAEKKKREQSSAKA